MAEYPGFDCRMYLWPYDRNFTRNRYCRRDGLVLSSGNEMACGHRLDFFAAVMRCNNYGGSITAIMLNTPGDVASCLTLLDGYAMTEKGRSVGALALSAMAAVVGGIIGIIVLMLFSPLLAEFALKFGPAGYFLVAILALSIISSMVKGNTVRGLISTGLGLTLATAGYDQITATLRFGFGLEFLDDGVPFVPVLVGLFAMAQALTLSESTTAICKIGKLSGSFWEGAKTYFKYPATIVRSTLVWPLVWSLAGCRSK